MPNDDASRLPVPSHRWWKLLPPQAVDLLLVAAVALPALCFAAVAVYDRNQTLAMAERDLLATLDTLHGHAESLLRFQALALGTADEWLRDKSDAELIATSAVQHAHLNAMRRHSGEALRLVVFGANGRPLVDSDRAIPLPDVDVSDRSYFRWHRDNPSAEPRVAAPVRSLASDTPIFFVTLRRSGRDGSFKGVIAAGIRQDSLIDFWDSANPNPGAAVSLLRDDGIILARRPAIDPDERAAFPPGSPVARAIAAGAERRVMTGISGVDGVERLFAFRRLDRFGANITHGVPRAEALAPWHLRLWLYGAFALTVAGALFALARSAKRRARDLHALNESLEQRVQARTAAIKAGEAHARLLAREVDHRAKNVLAVVQATLRLTPNYDAQAYATAVEGRVSALALAQTLLSRDRWSGASLLALLEAELAPFITLGETAPGPRATLNGPEVTLPPLAVQPLAMAMHELATNAVKHGALSRAGGLVTITWRLEQTPAGESLALRWAESGGPIVAEQPAPGFGSRVLDAVVRGQLEGNLSLGWMAAGLVGEIDVPLVRAGTEAGAMGEVAA